MNIGGRSLGPSSPPYVIAEIGVNHDGSLDRAIELVEAAAGAGADAVKFQLFRSDLLLSKASKLASYQSAAGEHDPAAMLSRLELAHDDLARACAHARACGLHAIVTAFSLPLVEVAATLPIDAFKTASPDIVNKPLLDALSAQGKPMIISTGAATLDEVERAAGWLSAAIAHDRLALLHCVSAYPTPLEEANLAGIMDLQSLMPSVAVGYSDHTQSVETGSIAVAAGACVLEKHLTHDRDAAGPDHAASLEPKQLAAYIEKAKLAWLMLGEGKAVAAIEGDVRTLSRQSIVAARDIAAGQVITADLLCIKRPGTGLGPWLLDELIGAKAVASIAADTPLTVSDIDWSTTAAGIAPIRAA